MANRVSASFCFKPVAGVLHVRAWVEDENRVTQDVVPNPTSSRVSIRDEEGVLVGTAVGESDPAGGEYVAFEVQVQLAAEHAYRAELRIALPLETENAKGHLPVPTVR